MKISDLCESERPREKLLAKGAEALGDGELLAILLRSGTSRESVLELSQRLLADADGSLCALYNYSPEQLASLHGIGRAKAASLLAAFELGKRFFEESSAGSGDRTLTGAHQVRARMLPRLKGLSHEESWILLLDRKGRMIDTRRITQGSGSETTLDIPRIVKQALEKSASSVILVHNHPSGDPLPSPADIRLTGMLRDALSACSLRLLDHIIISDDNYFSFNDEKKY